MGSVKPFLLFFFTKCTQFSMIEGKVITTFSEKSEIRSFYVIFPHMIILPSSDVILGRHRLTE